MTARVLRLLVCLGLNLLAVSAADPPFRLTRVCEILEDPTAYDGKIVAVVGRYSFRPSGRFFSEDGCAKPLKTGDFVWPSSVRVVFERDSSARPPEHLEIDGDAVFKLLTAVREHTALAKLHFGSPDYDRWAVGYGRIEGVKETTTTTNPPHRSSPFEPVPLRLVCHGEAEVVFIVNH